MGCTVELQIVNIATQIAPKCTILRTICLEILWKGAQPTNPYPHLTPSWLADTGPCPPLENIPRVQTHALGTPSRQKLEGWGYCMVKIAPFSRYRLIHPCDGQTDRRTGDSI